MIPRPPGREQVTWFVLFDKVNPLNESSEDNTRSVDSLRAN